MPGGVYTRGSAIRVSAVARKGPHVSEAPSVVVPTLNEEGYLGGLLSALSAQTLPPRQIIVADAGSTDRTVEVAREAGCIVVTGGMPAVGRNAGAAVAVADVILFLDADVVPHPNFIADAIAEFDAGGYAVATALIESLEPGVANEVMAEAVGLYLQMTRPFSPHAPGACIFVRRDAHNDVGGFDEDVVLAEDHDYVRRIAKIGEFGVLTSVRIPVSMRRMAEDSLVPLAINYLWCEMHALAGKPVYSSPFEYSFGTHGESAAIASERRVIDVEYLLEQAEEARESFDLMSARGRERLDWLVALATPDLTDTRVAALLDSHDMAVLRRYLGWRVSAATRAGSSVRDRGAASVRKGVAAVRRGISAVTGEGGDAGTLS